MRVIPPELAAFLNRRPRRLAALACLLLAGGSVLSAHSQGSRTGPSGQSRDQHQSVAVAARPIAAGAVITAADVADAQWPRALVPGGTVPDAQSVVGRRAAGAIGRGEAVTGLRLVGTDLAAGLPAGELAVPVSLADPDAGALVRAGDTIDLLAVPGETGPDPAATAANGRGELSRPGAITAAAGIRVLAVLPAQSRADSTSATELVVAAKRTIALRIATLSGYPLLAVRDDHP